MDSSNYIKGTNQKRNSIHKGISYDMDIYPYYISDPIYKSYFNFNNVPRYESRDGRMQIWGPPPKSKRILAPQIVVMNLNTYFKENQYDYDVLNSKLFKSNLNLFIKYQEKMVKGKILKVNKSALEFKDKSYNFYLKYKKTITEFLTHQYKNKWWEEGIDDLESLFETMMRDNWDDFGYHDNPFIEYPKRIFKSLPLYLLFPPSVMLLIFSKFKLESSYMLFKQKNNIKFYYDYLDLKRTLKEHVENINYARDAGLKVDYTINEYLESSDELLSGLNKIKNGKYYYNDNYLRKSSQQLISIPNSTNEFVVFSSQYRSAKADHEMAGWGDHVGTHPNYYANQYTLRENVPPGFFTDSRDIDIVNSRYLMISDTYQSKIDKLFQYNIRGRDRKEISSIDISSLYQHEDWEAGNHIDTHGLIYSNMKYYKKNLDNSWNVYTVKPQPVTDESNEDWNYIGQSKYSNIINYWHYDKKTTKFKEYTRNGDFQYLFKEARDETLLYVVEFDRKIEKIHMISELGIIETYNDTETSIKEGYSKFTPHFDYLNNYFSPMSSINKIEKIMEEYLDMIENKPLNFYQNRGTGILTNYISWKTVTPMINYPKSIVPIKY
jgi:hypothetical protein